MEEPKHPNVTANTIISFNDRDRVKSLTCARAADWLERQLEKGKL